MEDLKCEAKRRGFNRMPQASDMKNDMDEESKNSNKSKGPTPKKSFRGRALKQAKGKSTVTPQAAPQNVKRGG